MANEESTFSVRQLPISTENESSDRKSDAIPEIFPQITCHEIFTLHSTNDFKNSGHILVTIPEMTSDIRSVDPFPVETEHCPTETVDPSLAMESPSYPRFFAMT